MCVVCSSSVCEIKVEYVSFGGRPADLVLNFLTHFQCNKIVAVPASVVDKNTGGMQIYVFSIICSNIAFVFQAINFAIAMNACLFTLFTLTGVTQNFISYCIYFAKVKLSVTLAIL